jgi:hypothetical protein
MEGPWAWFVPDQLPAAFKDIPPASALGDVRVSVAGTPEAEDAMLDAYVPQTTAIEKSKVKLEVKYDGEPQFKKINGTVVEYATNTQSQVLRINGKYYACDQAVWFVAAAATGPWAVADSVPMEEIKKIPPSEAGLQRHVRGGLRVHARGGLCRATRPATSTRTRGTACPSTAPAGTTRPTVALCVLPAAGHVRHARELQPVHRLGLRHDRQQWLPHHRRGLRRHVRRLTTAATTRPAATGRLTTVATRRCRGVGGVGVGGVGASVVSAASVASAASAQSVVWARWAASVEWAARQARRRRWGRWRGVAPAEPAAPSPRRVREQQPLQQWQQQGPQRAEHDAKDAGRQKADRVAKGPNNVYADKGGNVQRQQSNGNWQSRDNGQWKNNSSSNNRSSQSNMNRDAQARQSAPAGPRPRTAARAGAADLAAAVGAAVAAGADVHAADHCRASVLPSRLLTLQCSHQEVVVSEATSVAP